MKKWALIFAIAGYCAAALYYCTSFYDLASAVCPVCANIDTMNLSPLQQKLRFTAVLGTGNAILYEALGFALLGSARYIKSKKKQL